VSRIRSPWFSLGLTGPEIMLLREDGSWRRLASEFDRRAGAESLTKTVFGPYSDVRIRGLHQHGGLESAVPGDRAHGF
jgi:hypothetical protein